MQKNKDIRSDRRFIRSCRISQRLLDQWIRECDEAALIKNFQRFADMLRRLNETLSIAEEILKDANP